MRRKGSLSKVDCTKLCVTLWFRLKHQLKTGSDAGCHRFVIGRAFDNCRFSKVLGAVEVHASNKRYQRMSASRYGAGLERCERRLELSFNILARNRLRRLARQARGLGPLAWYRHVATTPGLNRVIREFTRQPPKTTQQLFRRLRQRHKWCQHPQAHLPLVGRASKRRQLRRDSRRRCRPCWARWERPAGTCL